MQRFTDEFVRRFPARTLIARRTFVCITIGTAATMFWCYLEVLLRQGGSPILGLTLALLLGTAAGGLFGLVVDWIRSDRWLVSTLTLPICVVSIGEIDWLILRAAELYTFPGTLSVWTLAIGAGVAVGAVLGAVLPGKENPFGRYRRLIAISFGTLVLFISLEPLQRHAMTAAHWVPYGYLIGGIFVYLRGWGRRWLYPFVALVAGYTQLRLREPYLGLGYLAGYMAIVSSLMSLVVWIGRPPPLRRWQGRIVVTLVAGLTIGLLGIAAHHLVRIHASSWRSVRSAGMLSMIINAGHRLTDIDDDGFGTIFAQADCAPFDDKAFPGAHEIPGNAVDENCLGGPAGVKSADWVRKHEAINPMPPPWRGDIVIVLIDTLRFDDATDRTYRNLQRFSDQAVTFEMAYSTSSFTSFVLPGLFWSRLASSITFEWLGKLNGIPSETFPGLASMLAQTGYDTGIAGGIEESKSPYFDDSHFGHGFRIKGLLPMDATPARATVEALRVWGDLNASRPRFLFVHYLWAHQPQDDRASYRRAIQEVDAAFGTLRAAITGDALWVLVSDHGDEFYEHGARYHAATLYQEVVHVPLSISIPGVAPGKAHQVAPIRSLMPTLMAMVNPQNAPRGYGPYLCVGQSGCRDLPVPMALEMRETHLHGLVVGNRKVIRDLRREYVAAYDLAIDPGEKRPLNPVPRDLLKALLDWEEHLFGATRSDYYWPYR